MHPHQYFTHYGSAYVQLKGIQILTIWLISKGLLFFDTPCMFKMKVLHILPKDTLPKDTLPKDILPIGHFAERTAVCRKDNLPKIEMLFRQNVWDCDSFLNCVILNHCVK